MGSKIRKEWAIQNLIQACVVGSRLYGVATTDSDWDIRGVYLMPLKILLSPFEKLDTVSFLPQEDTVFYPLDKFMQMCLSGNPNIVEMLYIQPPMSIYSPIWKMVLESRDKFISAGWVDSMIGFAYNERRIAETSGNDERKYKAVYHYLRMLYLAKTLVTERTLKFPIEEEYRELLIAVRNRSMSVQEAIARGRELEKEINLATEQPWFPVCPSEETKQELTDLYVKICLSPTEQRLSERDIVEWKFLLQEVG